MDSRNFVFMFYGFTAAWLIIFVYVFTLLRRASRIRDELRRYEAMLELPNPRSEKSLRGGAVTGFILIAFAVAISPPHAAAHHRSESVSPLSGIRLSAGSVHLRSQEH